MSCNTNQQTSTIQNQIPSRGPQYLPGPELDSLRGALTLRHHDVLEEDGLVAVSPGDAGVVTRREGRLGVLEVVGGDEGSSQVMSVVTTPYLGTVVALGSCTLQTLYRQAQLQSRQEEEEVKSNNLHYCGPQSVMRF